MNVYFIIPLLSIGLPIVVWLFYAADTHLKLLVYVCGFIILAVGGYFCVTWIGSALSSLTTESESIALDPYVGGDIQTVKVDGQDVGGFKNRVQASLGQKIAVYGWIQSKLAPGVAPQVLLCNKTSEIPFYVAKVMRPDVAEHEKDPELLQSGFDAILEVPSDLALGQYTIKVVKKEKRLSQTYIPYIDIKISPPDLDERPTVTEKPKTDFPKVIKGRKKWK